jgi:cyanophycinase-like exopeptidase
MSGRITLVGGGELMPAMSRLHRHVLSGLSGPPRPVFIDVTAGFEPNVDAIVEKAVEYYRRYLQTELRVARYRHRERTSVAETAAAVATIRESNLVFAGPGSPTYALRQLRDSPVWEAIRERFRHGGDLLFASAAAIVLGRHALPVYEIYKVGADPYWEQGLDLFGELGLKLAVVPHFNDNSGGDNYDTRFCYVGGERFEQLQRLLADDEAILGIDHYTAVTFDPATELATVSGLGEVTIIDDEGQASYGPGSALPFAAFGATHRPVPRPPVLPGADSAALSDPFARVVAALEEAPSLSEPERIELLARVEALRPALAAASPLEQPLIDLILELRRALREAKRFDLADRARDVLTDLGYEIGDSPQGSTWSRR